MKPQEALLSQILQDNDIFYRSQPKDWWFDGKELLIFHAIESVLTSGQTADVFTVGDKMGDLGYVSLLSSSVPTTANYKYYADECRRISSIRLLKGLSERLAGLSEGSNPLEAFEAIDATIDKITLSEDYKILHVRDTLPDVVTELEKRYQKKGELPGISSGIDGLDEITDGFQKEKLYVIGARPSQGKSALMLNLASVISDKHNVGVISLESSWKEIVLRELSTISGINSQKLVRGFFGSDGFSRLTNAAEKIHNKNIFIYDRPNCSLLEVVGQARRMVQRHGCEIIFIDYLQLIQSKADTDRERVATASKRIKDLARELHVPIVALAQLRRDSDGRRPGLGDFQHTSQIEQDIDSGILIYHRVIGPDGKKANRTKPEHGDRLEIYLLVDKNRDGRTGAIEVEFDANRVKFYEKKS